LNIFFVSATVEALRANIDFKGEEMGHFILKFQVEGDVPHYCLCRIV